MPFSLLASTLFGLVPVTYNVYNAFNIQSPTPFFGVCLLCNIQRHFLHVVRACLIPLLKTQLGRHSLTGCVCCILLIIVSYNELYCSLPLGTQIATATDIYTKQPYNQFVRDKFHSSAQGRFSLHKTCQSPDLTPRSHNRSVLRHGCFNAGKVPRVSETA